MMKRTLVTAFAVVAMATPVLVAPAAFTPASAQFDVNFIVNTPPPPPRYEVVPAPRYGYVWAPGHWRWDGRQHVWINGVWVQERAGYRYVPDRWERYVDNGRERWRYHASRWDRNGDGIPDRYQGQALRDSDRDGVPDRYDSRPNNPYRR
jgi:hypothetical protein